MKRLDSKLARIRSGQYKRTDFIIADAKDGDMGPSLTSSGPHRQPDGTWTRYRSRAEFLDQIAAIVQQDIVDIMLVSASNLELLNEREVFHNSAVKPAIRANDTTDIWRCRGAVYHNSPSRPFRSSACSIMSIRRSDFAMCCSFRSPVTGASICSVIHATIPIGSAPMPVSATGCRA